MTSNVIFRNGEAVTTTINIATGTENDHASVIKLVRTYQADLEEFGRVGFEIQPFDTAGGTQQREIAILNEPQATLLLTYMRNTDIVRQFKKALVRDFYEMKQGSIQPKVLSPEEMFLAQAQMMVEHRQRLVHNERAIAAVQQEVGQLAESRVWDHCPQNCEPITKIRARMNKRYGLPAWVVDMVMRELPLSLKVHGMVRNNHESAEGSHYEVWAVADVTRVFKQFVSECKQETAWFATHPMIPERFKLRQVEGESA
jgi:phage regulator Rha-like protein